MWLVFMKFEGQGRCRTAHVTAGSKAVAKIIVDRALHQDGDDGLRLSEYTLFYAHATIHQKETNTFPLLNKVLGDTTPTGSPPEA
jgi:hypothetical protein